MWNRPDPSAALVLVACLALVACGPQAGPAGGEKPAKVEKASGAETATVKLTEQAAKRLDIKTAVVRDDQQRKAIPYAAVIYDANGQAWAFTNPQTLTYVRERISVERIADDTAVLTSGPAAGVNVVTTGAAELYGAELGVGK